MSSFTTQSAAKLRDVTLDYEFLPANLSHKAEILDLTLNVFLAIEPHSVALGITPANAGEFIGSIVTKSLASPYSLRVIHRASGKVIGARLMSISERDAHEEESDGLELEKQAEGIRLYAGIIARLNAEFWERKPEVNKVAHREISFVHVDHQRRGIAQHFLHLGLDFDQLKASGIDGIVSEASSIANQTLLLKSGFEEVARSTPDDYIRPNGEPVVFPDSTTTVKLLYLPLHT